MLWMNRFHDDHMAVVRILPKLEGILKDIEHGEAGLNAVWELKEFEDLITNVIIPHFKDEEKDVYPLASSVDKEGHDFMLKMYSEHNDLYEAFNGFSKALESLKDNLKPSGQFKNNSSKIISMSDNYLKNETPKNLDRVVTVETLGKDINKEDLVKHGYMIVQLLKLHIEQEETIVAELVKRSESRRE